MSHAPVPVRTQRRDSHTQALPHSPSHGQSTNTAASAADACDFVPKRSTMVFALSQSPRQQHGPSEQPLTLQPEAAAKGHSSVSDEDGQTAPSSQRGGARRSARTSGRSTYTLPSPTGKQSRSRGSRGSSSAASRQNANANPNRRVNYNISSPVLPGGIPDSELPSACGPQAEHVIAMASSRSSLSVASSAAVVSSTSPSRGPIAASRSTHAQDVETLPVLDVSFAVATLAPISEAVSLIAPSSQVVVV